MEISLPIDVSRYAIRDATRLAIQSAAAAAGMFMLMQSLGMPERFVGVLSAVLVVQPTVGNTVREAISRVAATLVGSVLGILCLWLLPGGYGTAAALALSMLVINAIAGLRRDLRYGVVAAVALALGAEQDAFETAKDRAIAIGVGAMLGAFVSVVVWPERAAKRARRHTDEALSGAADRFDAAIEGMTERQDPTGDDARRRFQSHIEHARQAADAIRLGDQEQARERIKWADRLYNSVLFINRVAEETDSRLEDELLEDVEEVRRAGREIVSMVVDGDDDASQRLESLRDLLSGIIENARDSERPTEDRVKVDALIFALGELEDSLTGLVEAQG